MFGEEKKKKTTPHRVIRQNPFYMQGMNQFGLDCVSCFIVLLQTQGRGHHLKEGLIELSP